MNTYLLIKWIHILSSVLLVGTGFGSAFYFYFILRSKNIPAIIEVSRLIVRADWWFTLPAVFVQPLTGVLMIEVAGYSYSQFWIFITIPLYLFVGLCWLPVVWLQIQMHHIATSCHTHHKNLPDRFWRYAKYWRWLGYPAFSIMLAVYALMVFKP